MPPACYTFPRTLSLTALIADCTSTSSSRRRRPSRTNPRSPLPILHRARRRIFHIRCRHQRPIHHNRCQHRHPLAKLPALHAQSTHDIAGELASQALRASPVHSVPKRHWAKLRRMSNVLAAKFQTHNRREIPERVQVQHPPRLRRRWWRCKPSRPRLHALFMPKTSH